MLAIQASSRDWSNKKQTACAYCQFWSSRNLRCKR